MQGHERRRCVNLWSCIYFYSYPISGNLLSPCLFMFRSGKFFLLQSKFELKKRPFYYFIIIDKIIMIINIFIFGGDWGELVIDF